MTMPLSEGQTLFKSEINELQDLLVRIAQRSDTDSYAVKVRYVIAVHRTRRWRRKSRAVCYSKLTSIIQIRSQLYAVSEHGELLRWHPCIRNSKNIVVSDTGDWRRVQLRHLPRKEYDYIVMLLKYHLARQTTSASA